MGPGRADYTARACMSAAVESRRRGKVHAARERRRLFRESCSPIVGRSVVVLDARKLAALSRTLLSHFGIVSSVAISTTTCARGKQGECKNNKEQRIDIVEGRGEISMPNVSPTTDCSRSSSCCTKYVQRAIEIRSRPFLTAEQLVLPKCSSLPGTTSAFRPARRRITTDATAAKAILMHGRWTQMW